MRASRCGLPTAGANRPLASSFIVRFDRQKSGNHRHAGRISFHVIHMRQIRESMATRERAIHLWLGVTAAHRLLHDARETGFVQPEGWKSRS